METMDTIDRVNTGASKATIFGWFAGLAWMVYSDSVMGLSWIDWALLVVVGMFAASIIIGGAFSLLAALLTKVIFRKSNASPTLFALAGIIAAIIAFLCAAPVAGLLASAPEVTASELKSFQCSEPLPAFTLAENSSPTSGQLNEVCACIWSKLPEGGWERRVSEQIRAGQDPGWRGPAFPSRFDAALKVCGGYQL